MRHRLAVLFSVLGLVLAQPVHASEFACAQRVALVDGVKGNQGIRTDPATVNGVGYVHPVQIDTGGAGGDFVAIGTANGAGVDQCANDYDPRWTIYADGETGGIYWCYDYTQDAYTTGANPTFQIYYDFCAPSGPTRWVLTFGGTQRRCVANSGTYGQLANVLLETTGNSTTDRNIDVKYTNVKVNLSGSTTWVDFAGTGFADPNYSRQVPSGTSVNAYLAPLD